MKSMIACLAPLFMIACTGLQSAPQQQTLEQVFASVHTSVVTLRTETKQVEPRAREGFVTAKGVGSGTLISLEGDILTAAHVVHTADQVTIEFFDDHKALGHVISSDPLTDLALVRVEGKIPATIAIARLAVEDKPAIGSRVFAVGAPLGASHTLTVGVVSALRLLPGVLAGVKGVEVVQTDAAINPGNSGGPLFDMRGRVIGVISSILTESGGNQGIGFAISARTARERMLNRSRI